MGRTSDAQDRLLAVALQLLKEKSYATVGVDAICKRAAVNKGSFYYYYATKSDLVVAAMEQAWKTFAEQVLQPAFRPEVPPLKRFNLFFEALHDQCQRQNQDTGQVCGCLFGSLGCEMGRADDPVRLKSAEIVGRIETVFMEALSDAAHEHLIDPNAIAVTAKALVAYWQGVVLLAKLFNNPAIVPQLGPQAHGLICASFSEPVEMHREIVTPQAQARSLADTWGFLD